MIDHNTDTTLNINIDSLDASFLNDLKKQFGSVNLEIHIQKRPDNWLIEEDFWKIIDLLDWSKSGDSRSIIQPAVQKLAEMPIANIHQFQDILSEKLWLLDTQIYAQVFIDIHPKGRLSVDDFLYARCAVIAEGKAYFEEILQHPEKMPQDIIFEPLLNIASAAYTLKTKKEFIHTPKYNYETYSNEKGWA
ncbi:DUF4240 domain-containing protein [Haliscomenobacter hydrossis]|uniref:DUF4240 domain-containing protein n=1 Tax=Haliscomenobacter hydrossis (strain ATCC 27775 / DSM 1100 / LMG 10767 / O) TaxID=760192 RepID=F4L243_HALH1|nr:DUF4240 domain-containing protein [Haliscomenobacter hydrossis]AEE51650.1 hypothetical protein Halhy_3798 [Haliscomenobacter hydrossis DSM 1100]